MMPLTTPGTAPMNWRPVFTIPLNRPPIPPPEPPEAGPPIGTPGLAGAGGVMTEADPASSAVMPLGSVQLVAPFPAYRWRFGSPAPNPVGSSLRNRPAEGEYTRAR